MFGNARGQIVLIVTFIIAAILIVGVFLVLKMYQQSGTPKYATQTTNQQASTPAPAATIAPVTTVEEDMDSLDKSIGSLDNDSKDVNSALNDQAVNLN